MLESVPATESPTIPSPQGVTMMVSQVITTAWPVLTAPISVPGVASQTRRPRPTSRVAVKATLPS